METLELVQLDEKIKTAFDQGATKFTNNPLHLKLRANHYTINDKLDFLPRMLFFVLGFKDLMQLVRYDNPSNETEVHVNQHSDEDSYHWRWYLNDLNYLNLKFNTQSAKDLLTSVWDDETYTVRETIYLFGKHIQDHSNPYARMLMVEVLETTFDKFKDAFHPVLKKYGLYEKLEYFGQKHQEVEEGHATGISEDEVAEIIDNLPTELKEPMSEIVSELFEQMYKMTANWAEA